jgi:hypothetical protein
MKKGFIWIILSLLLICLLVSCSSSDSPDQIVLHVDGYNYAFSLVKITKADNGNTVVEMKMDPIENSDGKVADYFTSMKVGGLFLLQPYIVCNGQKYENNSNSSFKNAMGFIYNYEFDTSKTPDRLFFYPSDKRGNSKYHWQIDPSTGKILHAASMTE